MVSPMQLCSTSLFSVCISTNLPKPVMKSLTEDAELHLPRRRRATVLALVYARSRRATIPVTSIFKTKSPLSELRPARSGESRASAQTRPPLADLSGRPRWRQSFSRRPRDQTALPI